MFVYLNGKDVVTSRDQSILEVSKACDCLGSTRLHSSKSVSIKELTSLGSSDQVTPSSTPINYPTCQLKQRLGISRFFEWWSVRRGVQDLA